MLRVIKRVPRNHTFGIYDTSEGSLHFFFFFYDHISTTVNPISFPTTKDPTLFYPRFFTFSLRVNVKYDHRIDEIRMKTDKK